MADDQDETPHGLSDEHLTAKDMSYSPSSGRETEQLQSQVPQEDAVTVLPGTGGPDDSGDVDVDDERIREQIARRNTGDDPAAQERPAPGAAEPRPGGAHR